MYGSNYNKWRTYIELALSMKDLDMYCWRLSLLGLMMTLLLKLDLINGKDQTHLV